MARCSFFSLHMFVSLFSGAFLFLLCLLVLLSFFLFWGEFVWIWFAGLFVWFGICLVGFLWFVGFLNQNTLFSIRHSASSISVCTFKFFGLKIPFSCGCCTSFCLSSQLHCNFLQNPISFCAYYMNSFFGDAKRKHYHQK